MFFLAGVAKYLFVPLAEAVVFAMLASYLLSRTLVPTMAKYLLRGHEEEIGDAPKKKGFLTRMQIKFEEAFERLRERYRGWLERCLDRRKIFLTAFFAICVLSLVFLTPWLGRDFFPAVDAGQFKLHLRARTGTRIEETARISGLVSQSIREEIPPDEIASIIDNIGLPYSGINLSYSNSAPIGPADDDILVSLSEHHHPTADYVHDLRIKLPQQFPGVQFSFLPADIVSQILNFGLPAPIDVQVVGFNLDGNRDFANRLLTKIRQIPGTVDVHMQQAFDQPYMNIAVDRTKAQQEGYSQKDVSNNLLISLSGSFQTTPEFWLDPKTGVSYSIATQTPQYQIQSLQDLENVPVTGPSNAPPQILASLASLNRGTGMAVVSHYDIQPLVDIYGSVQGRDLGGVANEITKIVDQEKKNIPRGSQVNVRGQIQTMRSSYTGLIGGLAFSIVLVYLLIVVNFQSWLDPFIIISALPAALAGIVWFLFVTHTTMSVPALIGSIMCMGVATANSILVVSFAKEQLLEGHDVVTSALNAGFTRFRPVIMTALAMIIGMVPMALGMGEGGEQNAPLGRAVIGGLLFATTATLFFVPVFFSLVHGKTSQKMKAAAKH
jgi:multidrug efflux pump subunit AcrB